MAGHEVEAIREAGAGSSNGSRVSALELLKNNSAYLEKQTADVLPTMTLSGTDAQANQTAEKAAKPGRIYTNEDFQGPKDSPKPAEAAKPAEQPKPGEGKPAEQPAKAELPKEKLTADGHFYEGGVRANWSAISSVHNETRDGHNGTWYQFKDGTQAFYWISGVNKDGSPERSGVVQNKQGQVSEIDYPGGEKYKFKYDKNGEISSVRHYDKEHGWQLFKRGEGGKLVAANGDQLPEKIYPTSEGKIYSDRAASEIYRKSGGEIPAKGKDLDDEGEPIKKK